MLVIQDYLTDTSLLNSLSLASSYVHDIDPYLVKFPFKLGPVDGIRWYGLSYLMGFIVAGLIMKQITSSGRSSVKSSSISDMIVILAIGAVVGGRVGYVLFYKTELLTQRINGFPYWGPLAVNQGGMASHGGILGALVACYWIAKRGTLNRDLLKELEKNKKLDKDSKEKTETRSLPRDKHSFLHILDLATFGTPMGLCFGRIANFINGELFGRPTSAENPLAVRFPTELDSPKYWPVENFARMNEVAEEIGYVPAESFTSFQHLVDTAIAGNEYAQKILRYDFAPRVVQASQLETELGQSVNTLLATILTPRHPSQLYQALLEGLALAIILLLVWKKPQKPGVVCGTFIFGYGVFRIAAEQFREPDAHLDYFMGLTRGQWLSLVMPVIGIIMIVICNRRSAKKIGGLLPETADIKAN